MRAPRLTAACVWRVRPALITALDDRFGAPVDAYVNGSQVWLRDDGPGSITLEVRPHPGAGPRRGVCRLRAPPSADRLGAFPPGRFPWWIEGHLDRFATQGGESRRGPALRSDQRRRQVVLLEPAHATGLERVGPELAANG